MLQGFVEEMAQWAPLSQQLIIVRDAGAFGSPGVVGIWVEHTTECMHLFLDIEVSDADMS